MSLALIRANPAVELNPDQLIAVEHGDRRSAWAWGPMLVVAGAGSGKTAMLAHRVAALILAGRSEAHHALNLLAPRRGPAWPARRTPARPPSRAGDRRGQRLGSTRGEQWKAVTGSCRPAAPASPQPPHAIGVESASFETSRRSASSACAISMRSNGSRSRSWQRAGCLRMENRNG